MSESELQARDTQRFTRSPSVSHVAAEHATKHSGLGPQPSSGNYSFCPYRPEWGDSSNSSSSDMLEYSADLSLSDLAFSMDIDDGMDCVNSISTCDIPKSMASNARHAVKW